MGLELCTGCSKEKDSWLDVYILPPDHFTLEVFLNSHLQQQAMDLLRELLYIRVQGQSRAGGWGSEDVLIQGCPAGW